jgi:hypothetical protein
VFAITLSDFRSTKDNSVIFMMQIDQQYNDQLHVMENLEKATIIYKTVEFTKEFANEVLKEVKEIIGNINTPRAYGKSLHSKATDVVIFWNRACNILRQAQELMKWCQDVYATRMGDVPQDLLEEAHHSGQLAEQCVKEAENLMLSIRDTVVAWNQQLDQASLGAV